jgi:hypothetical protein
VPSGLGQLTSELPAWYYPSRYPVKLEYRMRALSRVFVGLLCGYLIYLPFLFGVQYLSFHRLDGERIFYGLYSPFESLFLLAPSTWRNSSSQELLLKSVGGLLLIGGAAVSIRRTHRPSTLRTNA